MPKLRRGDQLHDQRELDAEPLNDSGMFPS